MKTLLVSFVILMLSFSISRAQSPKQIPEIPTIPSFQVFHKKVQCSKSGDMMAWLRRAGEHDFEYLGMQIPGPGFQIVVAITRNRKDGTFTVLETSSTGKSCIVSLGNFEGSQSKTEDEEQKL